MSMAKTLDFISSYRVSSVLNKDVKSYGKQNLFDGKEETCWNSDKGLPQWIQLNFCEKTTIYGVKIQFQGGFVGSQCLISCKLGTDVVTENFYPDDTNQVQTFIFSKPFTLDEIKLIFEKSTDFFGRITIYSLEILFQPG